MLTAQEAWNATNPDPAAYGLPDDADEADLNAKREEAAGRILAGAAANESYWNHRPELEALKAYAEGHGKAVLGGEGETPTGVGTTTAATIEGTATEEPKTELGAGGTGSAAAESAGSAASGGSVPAPDNPLDAVAKLRKQLTDANLTPEA